MGNLNGLDFNRLDLLERAIIDGLPLADVAHDQWTNPIVCLPPDHPINRHTSLCPGVLERTEQYRSEFAIHTLEFDENVVNAFQSAPFGKRHFQLRLMELVALAVHQMAAQLFNKNLRIHDKHLGPSSDSIEAVIFWTSQKPVMVSNVLNAEANFFTHLSYDNLLSYPKRAADVVGYWAEGRILGGVVSFATSEDPEPNPSLCSDRRGYPHRGGEWQLSDCQQQELLDFLLSTTAVPGSECPLPLRLSEEERRAKRAPKPCIPTAARTPFYEGPPHPHQSFMQAVVRWSIFRKQLGEEGEEEKEKNQE